MLTEVMRFYGLVRPPVDAGFFETEHHAQALRDIQASIMGGRLIAVTAVIGSGKTVLSRRLRAELEREGRVIVSRSLSIDKAKINLPLLEAALFYDLSSDKTVKISSHSERRERDLQDLFRRAKRPVALFVDDAHDLSISLETGLIRSLGAARGSRGCAWAHTMNLSEFMLSRVQAPSAPRACRPCRRSGRAHP